MTATTFTLSGAGPGAVLTLGNLKVATTSAFAYSGARATLSRSTGKWWFEVDTSGFTTLGGCAVGLVNTASPNYLTLASAFNSVLIFRGGDVYVNAAFIKYTQNMQALGSVMVAVDLDTNKIWFRSPTTGSGWNGDVFFLEDPDTGVGGIDISSITATLPGLYPVALVSGTPNSLLYNFGASAPIITPPTLFCPWDGGTCTPILPTVHLIQGPYYRLPPPTQVFTLTSSVPANCRLIASEPRDVFSSGDEVVAPANACDMAVTEEADGFAGEVASVTLPHGLINGEIIYIPQEDNGVRVEPEPFNQPFTIPYEDTVVIIPYEDR